VESTFPQVFRDSREPRQVGEEEADEFFA